MNIYIGSDHAGFEMKRVLVSYLELLGHVVIDKGPDHLDPTDDYPDFVSLVAEAVTAEAGSMGFVIGGTGTGEAIEANRLFGARAAVYYGGPEEIIRLSREHNDANILSLGARFISEDEGKRAVNLFLETKFSGDERHRRRILKLDN